jgi:hypothetical protein
MDDEPKFQIVPLDEQEQQDLDRAFQLDPPNNAKLIPGNWIISKK